MSSKPPTSESDKREAKRLATQQARRARGVQPLRLAPCGTPAAYRRHLRRGETPDALCLAAWAEENRKQRRTKRKPDSSAETS